MHLWLEQFAGTVGPDYETMNICYLSSFHESVICIFSWKGHLILGNHLCLSLTLLDVPLALSELHLQIEFAAGLPANWTRLGGFDGYVTVRLSPLFHVSCYKSDLFLVAHGSLPGGR